MATFVSPCDSSQCLFPCRMMDFVMYKFSAKITTELTKKQKNKTKTKTRPYNSWKEHFVMHRLIPTFANNFPQSGKTYLVIHYSLLIHLPGKVINFIHLKLQEKCVHGRLAILQYLHVSPKSKMLNQLTIK